MAVHFELPSDLERCLRQDLGDLDGAAKEALGVELYRQQKLTHVQLGRLLGLSRYETDGVLRRHGVFYDLGPSDVLADAEASRRARRG
jgi:hypothetical protein